MEEFIRDMQRLSLQNRTFAIVENGTWAPQANKLMDKMIGEMKNTTLLNENVSLLSAVDEKSDAAIDAMADAIVKSM